MFGLGCRAVTCDGLGREKVAVNRMRAAGLKLSAQRKEDRRQGEAALMIQRAFKVTRTTRRHSERGVCGKGEEKRARLARSRNPIP